jgi:hypothetical protein
MESWVGLVLIFIIFELGVYSIITIIQYKLSYQLLVII